MSDAENSTGSADRPLAGRRVVVTRPPGQADPFARRLRELGAEPVRCPTIRIVPPKDPRPLRRAARRLERYGWVVFTSVNGVDRLARVLEDDEAGAGDGPAAGGSRAGGRLDGVLVAAIGPATAARIRERLGAEPDVVPEEYRAEALAAAIRRHAAGDESASPRGSAGARERGRELEGERVLLPRAAEARPVLPERLEAAGAAVDEVPAYRAVPPDEGGLAPVRERLRAGEIDWLTFTASSTVRNFVSLLGTEVGGARVAAIGPITAGTARERGLSVDVVAEEYTVPGLLEALVAASAGDGREAA